MGSVKLIKFRDGASKENRSTSALDPDLVRLDDRSIQDMLSSTFSIADQIVFYNLLNLPDGDWRPFFSITSYNELALDQYLNNILDLDPDNYDSISQRDIKPHLALFLTFLALYEKLKVTINRIPARHFDFFVKDILEFAQKKGLPDQSNIVFELANNTLTHKLERGTSLLAGKGFNQSDLVYTTGREIILNQARITDWISSYKNPADFSTIYLTAPPDLLKDLAYKPVAEDKGWSAFSGSLVTKGLQTKPAETGWAIESPILLMNEGERLVYIEILYDWLDTNALNPAPVVEKPLFLEAYASTAKGWLKITIVEAKCTPTSIILSLLIPAGFPALISAADVLNNPGLKWPAIKFVLSPDDLSNQYSLLQNIGLKTVKITATINGMQNVALQNPSGAIGPGTRFCLLGQDLYRMPHFILALMR